MYGVLEYKNGRWKQPMALRVTLRQERVGQSPHTAEFVASTYPEAGWTYLVDSVESLELMIDPNYD